MSVKNATNIGSEIWAMANNLKGTMNANDYQNYVLAFMFYRYLSINQEKHLIKIIKTEENESIDYIYNKNVERQGVEIFVQVLTNTQGYIILPEFTWASLMSKIENNTLNSEDFSNMFKSFSNHGKQIPNSEESYADIFSNVNLVNLTAAKTKTLVRIIRLIDSIEYKSEDGRKVLAEIYEYFISQFATSLSKKGQEFYTPAKVSEVLARLVSSVSKENVTSFSIYDPTMGSGSLLLKAGEQISKTKNGADIKYYGQEINKANYNLARMNLMLHEVDYENINFNNSDTLESNWLDSASQERNFDAIVANLPYSAKWDNKETKLKDPRFKEYDKLAPATKADFAFIQHAIYHLKETGKMAFVLPHGVLFRGAAEATIRQALIEKNYLDAVIGLPANLFYGTSIPTCILVFSKNKTSKDILFIDASNEFEKGKNQNNITEEHISKVINTYKSRENIEKYSRVVNFNEIKENHFNLNIPRYVDTFEEEEEIDLSKVSEEIEKIDDEISKLEEIITAQLKKLDAEI